MLSLGRMVMLSLVRVASFPGSPGNANMYHTESLVSFLRKHDVIKIGPKQKGNILRVTLVRRLNITLVPRHTITLVPRLTATFKPRFTITLVHRIRIALFDQLYTMFNCFISSFLTYASHLGLVTHFPKTQCSVSISHVY